MAHYEGKSFRKYRIQSVVQLPELRVVFVGKTGAGKSASGNTILGRKEFHSTLSSRSITKESVKATATVGGRNVTVVDTPGFFDTELTEEEVRTEIVRCMALCSPGPHVFLVVIPVRRFTQEEKAAVQKIQVLLGDSSHHYALVLFTHQDHLGEEETIEEFIADNEHLKKLVEQCGNRYHSFNNKNTVDHTQVTELLEKIVKMVTLNGGQCYTNELYQKVEEEIQKTQDEILMERKVQQQKEKDDKEREKRKLKEEEESFASNDDPFSTTERYKVQQMQKYLDQETEALLGKESHVKKKEDDLKKQARVEAEKSSRCLQKILKLVVAVPTGLLFGALVGAGAVTFCILGVSCALDVLPAVICGPGLTVLAAGAASGAILGGVAGVAVGVKAALDAKGPVEAVKATCTNIIKGAKNGLEEVANLVTEQKTWEKKEKM